ncbi:MAG: DUF2971 domain-containing protein [Oscillospiraceae bacterium]
MVSNQEKIERLSEILKKLNETQDNEACSLSLHTLLLDDCGGKLYKYMPIKDYTIPTINNNTLHFSSPSVFNDPFECKVGIDYYSLVEELFLKEFDKRDSYFDNFLLLRSGQKTLSEIPIEQLPIIHQWENSKTLIDFLDRSEGVSMSEEEVNRTLFDNFDVVLSIINPLIDDVAGEKNMPIISSELSGILENLTEDGKMQLIQNKGTYSDYVKGFGVDIDADEIELTEKAYEQIHPENKEAIEQVRELFNSLEQKLNESLYTLFKVCCLCTSNKNKLMWSHYADSHRGICIEYDFSDISADAVQPMPVFYTNKRPKLPWRAAIAPTPENQSEAIIHFMKALLTKDELWSYENEWRLIVQSSIEVSDLNAPPIKCIYIGALCSEENKEAIKVAAKKLNVPVKQMKVDRGEFELHTTDI